MKEQVFITPVVDKSKTSVREPLDSAFSHCLIPQKKCAAALPENTVFRLLHCKRFIPSNWHGTDVTCQSVDVDHKVFNVCTKGIRGNARKGQENRAPDTSEQHAARTCHSVPKYPLGGGELSDDSPGNRPVSKQREAEYDAFPGVDLELVAVIQAWAGLPESVKTAVMEMVRGLRG